MIDEVLKTVILGAPNFIGFIFCIWILSQRLTKQDELIVKLLSERSEQGKSAEREFSDERSGASQTENSVLLPVANEQIIRPETK